MSTDTAAPPAERTRVAVPTVLAIQGVGALLFAFAQVARLFDPDWLTWIEPLDGFFKSSNLAFSVLLATEGFAIASLLADRRSPREVVLRVVGYVAAFWLLIALVCLGAVALQAFDSTDDQTWDQLRPAIGRALSLTMNVWAANNPLAVPGDLAMLWYFSIVAQLAATLTVAGLVLRRWPRFLGTVLLLGAVSAAVYRGYAVDTDGWFAAALSTPARADAFLAGAAAVFLLRPLPARIGAGLCGGALLTLVGLVISSAFLDVDEILTYQLPLVAVAMAAYLVGARSALDERALTIQMAVSRDTITVARVWRDLVAWSPLVVVTVRRHLFDQPYAAGTWTAVVALAVVATLSRGAMDRILGLIAQVPGELDRGVRDVRGGRRRAAGSTEAGTEDRGARREPPAEG